MQSTFKNNVASIRRWLAVFMTLLFISGFTAIPLEWELRILSRFFETGTAIGNWFEKIYLAIRVTSDKYPFLFYGFDWLAFAHFILAILFIGPYNDPVRNKWVIQFGIWACILVIPFALVAGYYRGIPFFWRFADCSFGFLGLIPLSIIYQKINQLELIILKNKEYETTI